MYNPDTYVCFAARYHFYSNFSSKEFYQKLAVERGELLAILRDWLEDGKSLDRLPYDVRSKVDISLVGVPTPSTEQIT